MKTQPFDSEAAIRTAWNWCWAYYCGGTSPRQSWLSATDLERRVRAAAAEQLDGVEVGTYGPDAWGHRLRIRTGERTNLLGVIREWLSDRVAAGTLTGHNFGRGHCSGMRLRPAGMELTASEKRTLTAKAKRAAGDVPVHAKDPASRFPALSLCSAAARATNKAKQRGYSGRRSHRTTTRTTDDAAKVTCPRCLKLLQNS